MKTVNIDFTKDTLGTIAREGELNKTQIVFALDEDLQKCDFINVEFKINDNCEDNPILEDLQPDEGGTTLTIKLDQNMTVDGMLTMQLVGYVIDSETAEPHMIAKSPVVSGTVTPSIKGIKKASDGKASLLDRIQAKVHTLLEKAHEHNNKEIIDSITEDSLSPEIPLVYELPTNPKKGDICRFISSEITTADGGRTVIFDYTDLENFAKKNKASYTLQINADADEHFAWLKISVVNYTDEIRVIVERYADITNYNWNNDGFEQWYMYFNLNDNGEWELSTEENDIGYQKSYYYSRETNTSTPLLEPLTSVKIPNEFFYSVTVEKNTDINIFHLEPILMLYDGEWRAVANESVLYKRTGATIEDFGVVNKVDGSKVFRLNLDWGKEVAPLAARRCIDIPISDLKESTDINGNITLNGSELELGIPGSSGTLGYDRIENATETVLQPNKEYVFGEVETLTLDFAEGIAGKRNEYLFSFISPGTATVLTLPSSVKWVNELTVEPNKRYEISVVDNIALWCAVDYEVTE